MPNSVFTLQVLYLSNATQIYITWKAIQPPMRLKSSLLEYCAPIVCLLEAGMHQCHRIHLQVTLFEDLD